MKHLPCFPLTLSSLVGFTLLSSVSLAQNHVQASGPPPPMIAAFDGSGKSTPWMQLLSCKLDTCVAFEWVSSGDFAIKQYRPGRPVFGNIVFRCAPGAGVFDDMVDAMMQSVALPPTRAKVEYSDDWQTRRDSLYTYPACTLSSWSSPACDRAVTTPTGGETFTLSCDSPPAVAPIKHPAKVTIPDIRLWSPSNFSLSIPGLDTACARVSKIDSFTIKQGIADLDGDGHLDLTVSDLVMEIPVDAMDECRLWLFGGDSRTCTLDYLAADGSVMRKLTIDSVIPLSISTRSSQTCTVTCSCSHLRWMAP